MLRNFILQYYLLTQSSDNIIEQLGGTKQYKNIETLYINQNNQFKWPVYNIIKRKPKLYKQKKDITTISDSELLQMQYQNCLNLLKKLNITSQQMNKQIIEACQYDEILCFQTSISACMKYIKGKCENNLKQIEKPLNFIKKKIEDEITMIKTLNYNVIKIDQKYDQSLLDIQCYENTFSIIKVSVPIEALNNIEIDILYYLQNPENYQELLQQNKQNFEEILSPLIVDKGTYKYNLQLQGCYPYCLPIINIQSDILSSVGKSIIIQHLYETMQKPGLSYKDMRIFNSLIEINNGLEQKLEQIESQLHFSFNKSTLNIKKLKHYKQQLQGSYVQRIGMQLDQQIQKKLQFLIINPFLTILNDDDQNRIKSSIKIWYHGEQHNILIKQSDIDQQYIQQSTISKFQQQNDQKQLIKNNNIIIEQQLQNQIFQINNYDIINQIDQDLKQKFINQRQKLPIMQHKDEIMEKINNNQIIIITAETGTGKSTNIPQIIFENQKQCKILITEPRKIAAISLARRVQQESGLQWKNGIGYQVLNDNQINSSTIINYSTIGVVLRRIYNNINTIQQYTHIIIDEVHEKSIEIIVLLGIIKILLQNNFNLPKIIIMSATIQDQQIQQYFNQLCKVSIMNIKGKQFNLDIRYSETKIVVDDEIIDQLYFKINQILKQIQQLKISGNILIFLPGIREIQYIFNNLLEDNINYEIIQCHSQINQQDFNKIFSDQKQKIILSTNIAEASVTIPNIEVVIDSGLERRVQFHLNKSRYNYSTVLISKQSAIQRAGRAGRVKDGYVFRCYNEQQYQNMQDQKIFDIKISDISGTFINLISLSQKYQISQFQPDKFFIQTIETLDQSKIQQNIQWLLNNDFIFMNNQQYQITESGYLSSQLPIQPIQSKLIILCNQFQINIKDLDIIISILNSEQITFKQNYFSSQRYESDILQIVDAYKNGFLTYKSQSQIKDQIQNIQNVIINQHLDQYKQASFREIYLLLQILNRKNLIFKNVKKSHFYQITDNFIADPHKQSIFYHSDIQLLSYQELLKTGQFNSSLLCSKAFIIGLLMQYEAILYPQFQVYSINQCNIQGNLKDITLVIFLLELFKNFNLGLDLIKILLEKE